MKTKITTTTITALALPIVLISCGKGKEEEADNDGRPKSSQGAILEAAKNATDKANERTRRLGENTVRD